MYLGIKWVLTKSFARIHKANLINFGILPLNFENEKDYKKISQGDKLRVENVIDSLKENRPLVVTNLTTDTTINAIFDLTERQKNIIFVGGLLNYTRENQ